MSKYIKENSISIGYNNTGQSFFDMIMNYSNYIHSYFLSFTESMKCNPYNIDEIKNTLKKCDTYHMPANILFNTTDDIDWKKIIDDAKEILNVNAVTVFTLSIIEKIKSQYPDISIHLSVRYFDWIDETVEELIGGLLKNDIYELIDVINISGARSYTDHNLISFIHALGIKTKMIINEGCVPNRSLNYGEFPGFEKYNCKSGPCTKGCKMVMDENHWMELTRINMFKEMLQYYDIDILKLSSRDIDDNDYINKLLEYWTSDEPTQYIPSWFSNVNVDDNYDSFLEWCEIRSKCDGYCYKCQKCRDYYNQFIK